MVTPQTDLAAQVRAEAEDGGRRAIDMLAARLKAAGEPTRVRLLALLGAGPDGGLTVTDLRPATGLSQPTVSHHLRILNEAGLVNRRKVGVWAFYTVNTDAVAALGEDFVNVVGTPTERRARRRRLVAQAVRAEG